MAKLGKEQVMVARQMIRNGQVSIRQVARQLGVTEGALRYRLRKGEAGPAVDGRWLQPTAVGGLEEAVGAILERLGCFRVTGEGRPVQARTVCESCAGTTPTREATRP